MLCEKCNTEMIYFKDGNSCGWNCPKCGNGVVTTFIEDIRLDETLYTIALRANPEASAEDLKIISKLASLTILEAKKLASTGGTLLEGKATIVKDSITKLKSSSMLYDVSPAFPYET